MNSEQTTLSDRFFAVEGVFDQTVSLFHLLRALAEQVHEHGELTSGLRGILRGLDQLGPQTVPQMARARPVSRQHIQLLVNQLEADGLVELVENIAHKRSRLVRLTPKGKAYLEAMYRREYDVYATLALDVPEEALRGAADVLHSLHDALQQVLLRFTRDSEQQAKPEQGEAGESQ